jgi:MFS family permease
VALVHRTLGLDSLPADFRRLWWATGASNLADGILRIALAVTAVRLTSDPLLVAGVTIAGLLPLVLLVLVSGVIADRVERRRILIVAQSTRIATIGVLALLATLDAVTLPVLFVAAFVLGIQQTFYDTTSQTLVPVIVADRQITRANARLFAAEILTEVFVGPPLGGLLIAAGAVLAFGGTLVGYGIALAGVLLMTGTYRVRGAEMHGSIVQDIREGLSYLASHPLQRVLTSMVALSNFAGQAFIAVFALYAIAPGPMGLSEVGFGILLASFGIGSLFGTAIAERVERRLGTARTLLACQLVSALTYFVPAVTSEAILVGASIVVAGAAGMTWGVVNVSLRQRFIPRALYGRVQAGHRLAANLAGLAGGILAGIVGTVAGLPAAFAMAGIGSLLACLGWLWVNDRSVAAALAAGARSENVHAD